MGALKDLVDLVTQLAGSVQDRKFAAELREIQSMIGNIQSEHAALHEQSIELMTENAELKQTIASLKEEVAALKEQKAALVAPAPQTGEKLSPEAEAILQYLAKVQEANAHQIAQAISKDLVTTEYWIEILTEKDMIYFSVVMDQPTEYYLVQKGREYLVKNEMV